MTLLYVFIVLVHFLLFQSRFHWTKTKFPFFFLNSCCWPVSLLSWPEIWYICGWTQHPPCRVFFLSLHPSIFPSSFFFLVVPSPPTLFKKLLNFWGNPLAMPIASTRVLNLTLLTSTRPSSVSLSGQIFTTRINFQPFLKYTTVFLTINLFSSLSSSHPQQFVVLHDKVRISNM